MGWEMQRRVCGRWGGSAAERKNGALWREISFCAVGDGE